MIVHGDAEGQLGGEIQRPFIGVDLRNGGPYVPISTQRSGSRRYSLACLGGATGLYQELSRVPPQTIITGIGEELPDLFDGRFHCGDRASVYLIGS